MRLFCEKGYTSTNVADLLKAAGVSSGSLHSLFPGKQDLLLAVLDAYRSGIRKMLLEPAWRDVTDPIEKIFALLARYLQLPQDTHYLHGCPNRSPALTIHPP